MTRSRFDKQLPHVKVPSRLLFGPERGACRKGLQRRAAMFMANNAPGVSGTFLQKDGLHLISEESVVENGSSGSLLGEQRHDGQEHQQSHSSSS